MLIFIIIFYVGVFSPSRSTSK